MKHLVEPISTKEDIVKIEQYLKNKNKRNHLIYAMGINSGLRVSDILKLNIQDVKDKNFIEIIEKKTGKYKRFPLNNKLQQLIKKYLPTREKLYALDKSNPLFIGKKHKRLHRSQVYRFLNEACNDLGIDINVGCHSMRKSFGKFFYEKYNNIALLQKILNHSAPSITLRYIGITQDEIDESYINFEL